jgi:hypothetical protein
LLKPCNAPRRSAYRRKRTNSSVSRRCIVCATAGNSPSWPRRCCSRGPGRQSKGSAAAARAHLQADVSSLSVHLGNAPEPRPHPLFGAAFAGGGLLVGPDEGSIEHYVRIFRIIDESGKHPLPHAVLRPARKAFMHALPFAVPLGQLVPLRSGPQDPENPVDEQTVVLCGSAGIGFLARQQIGDTRPLLVIELVPLRYALRSESDDPKRNESEPIPDGNLVCRFNLEGLVSKHCDRPYRGGRQKHWIKVKNRKHPAMDRVAESFR